MPPPPAPSSRIVIAGVGLITPLGHSAWQTFSALLGGRRVTDRIDQLEHDTQPVPLVQAIGGVSVARHTRSDPTVELAERAAREAAAEAGVALDGLRTWLGTSKGAVGAMSDFRWGMRDGGWRMDRVSSRLAEAVALGPHGYLSHHLSQRTGLTVHRHAVAACASSLAALDQARRALLHPRRDSRPATCDLALVLTSEAALLPAFIHSYQRLGVLAPLTLEGYRQAPLDASRRGFVLSEAGAAVLLKRLEPGEPPKPGQIELLDTATACEARDLIRPSREMAALRHVAGRLLAGRRIAALHPHAPGTAEHDPAESAALHEVLRDHALPGSAGPPAVYANKGAVGHTLGSAGLVSLVLACLAARSGRLPPMPWLSEPIDSPLPLHHRPAVVDHEGVHGIFAAGFGGHVAGAVIRSTV